MSKMGDSEIIADLVSQSEAALGLVPDLPEKYRCMVVWDTRFNRDVGWLMVRRNGSDVLKPEEMEDNMKKCQWRSCNIDELNLNLRLSGGHGINWNTSGSREESETNGSTDVVGINYDEASTSTETKKDSVAKQVQQRVECAVQV